MQWSFLAICVLMSDFFNERIFYISAMIPAISSIQTVSAISQNIAEYLLLGPRNISAVGLLDLIKTRTIYRFLPFYKK